MTTHDMPPTSGHYLPDVDHEFSTRPADERPLRSPRFGRLALWIVSASALAVGVAGTVAYRVWFSQDQRAYVEAMANARENLGMTQAAQAQPTLSSGAVDTTPTPPDRPIRSIAVESADFGQPAVLDAATTTAVPPDSATLAQSQSQSQSQTPAIVPAAPGRMAAASKATPQTASARASRSGTQTVAQNRRHASPHAKQNQSLFARMGSFFHRVNYRQNVSGSQRDEYSRP